MDKHKKYLPIVLIILMALVFFNTCGTKGKIKILKKEIVSLNTKLSNQDSIISNTISEERLVKYLELEGLKISKRTLYDQNAIIRTTVRPDDKMNEYDKEIELINQSLK